jgi:hypothetical protein
MDNTIDLERILEQHIRWLRHESGGERANLSGANLSGAILCGADLREAQLEGAILGGTCLDPDLIAMQREFCRACPADADGYRIVYRTATSQHMGGTTYEPGNTYETPFVSADIVTACHPGIYAASLKWMRENYGTKLVKCRVQDGDWFITAKGAIRTARLEVLEYVD